jgi:hypothetical protein
MLSAASLVTSPIYAQQKTRFSLGLNTGYILAYDRDSEDWGALVGLYIQLQEGHWALQAEIDYVPKCTFLMPFVDLVYNLRPSEEGKFSPYVSIGIGGHGDTGEYFDIYSRIRVGMRLRILTAREGMLLLNVGLTSVHAFPFAPFWFSPSIGIEYSYR